MKISYEVDAKYFTLPFKQLIELNPELGAFLTSVSPPKFDLGNPDVLSQINKSLYKELLDLDIIVSDGFLIPSLGIRYAYVDIVTSMIKTENKCIEIGTGASAAISLILAKKYMKDVYATEINNNSIILARKNVTTNNLQNSVTLFKSEGQLLENLIPRGNYSALFCYPPIYDDDLTKLEKKRGWKGTSSELIGGGKDGLDFTKQLISEALNSDFIQIELITVMLMNEQQVRSILEKIGNDSITEIFRIKAGTRNRFVLTIRT